MTILNQATILRVNQEIRIHPATDLFMKGVNQATIRGIGKKFITLYHSPSKTKHKVDRAFAEAYFMTMQGEMMFPQPPDKAATPVKATLTELELKTRQERMRYLGVLGIMCEASVHVPEDIREQMERALADACEDGTLQWRRVIDRLEIETVRKAG